MYTLFLAGGIASGKSTVARELSRRGALRVDLDEVSRSVCAPGSPVVSALACEFGRDLIDPLTGELDRHELARRCFADEESTSTLERIELPAIRDELAATLTHSCCGEEPTLCVVEIPLLDRVDDLLPLADEVMAVVCPLEVRRERAKGRGMDAGDFDRRVLRQPTDEYLRAHADTVLDNEGDEESLLRAVDAWWRLREGAGWSSVRQGTCA